MLPDEAARRRLHDLAVVWGAVRFLHPWLAYRAIDWHDACAECLPSLIDAADGSEFKTALRALFDRLEDPLTGLHEESPDRKSAALPKLNIPVLRLADIQDADAKAQLRERLAAAVDAERLVIDLRDGAHVAELWELLEAYGAAGNLSRRERLFEGWPPARGQSVYQTAFVVLDARREATVEEPIELPPITALVDQSTGILGVLLAQAIQAGGGTAIAHGAVPEPGTTMRLEIGGVSVRVRTSEFIATDGVVGFVPDAEASSLDDVTDAFVARTERSQREPAAFAVLQPPKKLDESFPTREERIVGWMWLWNVVRYFFAYHHLTDRPWDAILDEYLAKIADSDNEDSYVRTVAEACTHLRDSHVGVLGPAAARVLGAYVPALGVACVEGEAVVTGVSEGSELRPGDIIRSVDGRSFAELARELESVFAASSVEAHKHQVARRWMLVGQQRSVAELVVEGPDGERELRLERNQQWFGERDAHHAPNLKVIDLLPSGLGYVNLVGLLPESIDEMMKAIEKAPAVVFDVRGYPNNVFPLLAPRFARDRARAALFRRPDLRSSMEGSFSDCSRETWSSQWVEPQGDTYEGRVAVLIDMNAISQSEHTGLWLEAACDPIFVGSPTRGANGNVTTVGLPGGLGVQFTGLDTRHGDGRQLQRVGIEPHIAARPTIEGVRAGRDEVLERAVQELLAVL